MAILPWQPAPHRCSPPILSAIYISIEHRRPQAPHSGLHGERGRLEKRCPTYGEPRVRIHLPPPASLLRTRLPLPARDVPPVARILSRHRWPRSSYVRLLTR